MAFETVNPNIENFVESIRDVGYTFEIAVADIIDNSITANASSIEIYTAPTKEGLILTLFDDGNGMNDQELTEAMRLATKNPNDKRGTNDLGRFGLGLKTASFSQCKKLTVATKKNDIISIRCWDLLFIAEQNSWDLKILEAKDITDIPLFQNLNQTNSGTLIIWQDIDRYKEDEFSEIISDLSDHLSLVFHRFLDGECKNKKLEIKINNQSIKSHNPFNTEHPATLEIPEEKLSIQNQPYIIKPYILPHHTKVIQAEWLKYESKEGYIKAQGFYLYREKRLLTYGTWWGLHKARDAHKLARIQIDITNSQDKFWGIDVKKSVAYPIPAIRNELKRIISNVTKTSSKPFRERGRRISDRTIDRFWLLKIKDNQTSFKVNREHPIFQKLQDNLTDEQKDLFDLLYKGLETYLPLQAIQSQMQSDPHSVKQKSISEEELNKLIESLRQKGFDEEWIEQLKRTELSNSNN